MTAVPLTDASVMPYGKHKGKTMINVPAAYLIYLYDNQWFPDNPDGRSVKAYVTENMDVLKAQTKRAKR